MRFDLFNFPKGTHSREIQIWKENARTSRGRLAHEFVYQTRSIIAFQHSFVVHCSVLLHTCNYHIETKLFLVYGKGAFRPRIIDAWAACFRSRMTCLEEDQGLGRPSRHNFNDLILSKTIENKMIQFCLLESNNSSEYYWKRECASPENMGWRQLAPDRQSPIANLTMVLCHVRHLKRRDLLYCPSPPIPLI
jgi:hypothetical protein